MRRLISAVVLSALVSTASAANAQQAARPAGPPPGANGGVTGVILDAKDSLPLARSSVTVRSRRDSSLVTGAIAGPDGLFRAPGLRPGGYYIRVTAIGHSPSVKNFAVTDSNPIVNLGKLYLPKVAVELSAVNVVEDRNTVAIEPDRNSYRAKDVAPAAANASEVLDATPSVSVDQDGKVSLRGNENVVVQINGRPTPMSGTQLGAYLKTLPANVIERIEVVGNPSAKYDPEGMAGIINIALKSQVDLGYSGGGTAQAANSNRYNGGGNLGYQVGKVTSFVNLGINNDYRNTYGVNDLTRVQSNGFTNQDINTLTGNKGQNLNANMDYKFNARDVWSNQLSLNHRSGIDQTSSAIDEKLNGSGTITSYDRVRDTKMSGNFVDYDMAFKRTFEPRKHEWSAEARVNRSQDEDNTNLFRHNTGSTGYVEGERDYTKALSKSLTMQSDYMKMTAPRTKIELGWKSTARWLDRDFDVQKDATGSGTWATASTSSALTFDEQVHAVYGVLSQGLGKFDLQAGLRGEEANRDFKLKTNAQNYPYRYGSVFPSGVVSYNFSELLNAKLSYSRRIRRPGTQELNPFPNFFDIQNVFFGNPNLNAEYTDAIEGGINKQYQYGSFQLSPFYRHTTNAIQPTIKTGEKYEGRDVTTITFGNFATSNSYGTDVNGTFRLGQKLNALGGFNLFKVVTDGSSLTAVSTNTITWQARTSISSWVTPTFMMQVNYQYRAPMKIPGGEFQQMHNINFAFRKKIDGDNSSIMLRVLDPFSTNKFRVKAGDDNILQLTERSAGVRGVFLVYQYTFGQVPRIRQVEAPSQQGGTPFP